MYPHERSLVKRLVNKPFALLGVNSDTDRAELQQVLKQEQITWRSWWNGGSTSGPISTLYRVTAWPTIYVLDAKGIIRYKNVRGPALDAAVNRLLKELAKEPVQVAATKRAEDEGNGDQAFAKKPKAEKPVDPAERAKQEAARKLRVAKMLDQAGSRDKARVRYQEIIDEFADTTSAAEARELLEKMRP